MEGPEELLAADTIIPAISQEPVLDFLAGLELKQEYIRFEPPVLSCLQITLEKQPVTALDPRSRWRLQVAVPPNGLIEGPFPEHSAILLQIPGQPPRQIRIPVTGAATQ